MLNEAPSISTEQKLTHTLAPQMLGGLSILEKDITELKTEIYQQMLKNPLIEEVVEARERPLSEAIPEEKEDKEVSERELQITGDGREMSTVFSANDSYRDYFLQNMENASSDEEAQTRRQKMFENLPCEEESLQDHLMAQLKALDLPDEKYGVAEMLIGQIDENGYLDKETLEGETISKQEIDEMVSLILTFHPHGCGARSPKECLLAQLDKLDDSPWQDEVRAIIENHLPDIAAKRLEYVAKRLGITTDELEKALIDLRTLDPKPGRAFSKIPKQNIIVPEVYARYIDNEWVVSADYRLLPEIRISRKYEELAKKKGLDPETKKYLLENINAANALKENIYRRQDTVQKIAQAILDAQPDFHKNGKAGILPLTQVKIAEITGYNSTTVSRTVHSKYISTPHGIFALDEFFTTGKQMESGIVVTKDNLKERLKKIIDEEDPTNPLSDDAIAKMLTQDGFDIKRRTVAKYRGELKIPGTSARRIR